MIDTRISIIIAVLMLGGCSYYQYRGDGQFVDRGVGAAHERYVLTLPNVNLCEKGTYHYLVGRLPSEWWSILLRYPIGDVDKHAAGIIAEKITLTDVRLTISDKETDKLIHNYEGPLEFWASTIENPRNSFHSGVIEGGNIEWYLDGELAALFDPKNIFGFPYGTKGEREIILSVLDALPQLRPNCEAKFVIVGGGWK